MLTCLGPSSWERVGLRQMSGILLICYARSELLQRGQARVGELATASVACGVMGVGGNKGGVGISLTLFRRRVTFVGSHFAAHQVRELSQGRG